MQNLERYYGFSAEVMTLLEPERLEQIRAHAVPILEYKGYNPAEYHIYCHQLRINENLRHWSAGTPLHRRVETLRLTFRVNPKQRKSGSIMFLNWRFGMSIEQQLGFLSGDVAVEGGSWNIHYDIRKQFVQGETTFKNAIVTFVKREVRPDHRKIKIELVASPTHEHEARLKREQAVSETRLDLRLRNPIRWNALLLPPPERKRAAHPRTGRAYLVKQLQEIEERLEKERSRAIQLPPQTSLFPAQPAPAGAASTQLEQRRNDRIRKLERAQARTLDRLVGKPMSEADANTLLGSLEQLLIRYEEPLRASGNLQILEVLEQRSLLSNSERPIGSRLKLAIPVIPLLLHYELDLSPDGALTDAWQRLRRFFGGRKRPKAPPAAR